MKVNDASRKYGVLGDLFSKDEDKAEKALRYLMSILLQGRPPAGDQPPPFQEQPFNLQDPRGFAPPVSSFDPPALGGAQPPIDPRVWGGAVPSFDPPALGGSPASDPTTPGLVPTPPETPTTAPIDPVTAGTSAPPLDPRTTGTNPTPVDRYTGGRAETQIVPRVPTVAEASRYLSQKKGFGDLGLALRASLA